MEHLSHRISTPQNNIEITEAFTSCVGHGYRGGKGRKPRINLLSDDICVMGSLGLEAAVVGPKVDRGRDTGNTTFVNLELQSQPRARDIN